MRRRAQPWLGTLVEIMVDDSASEAAVDQACNRAFDVISRVHALMSFHGSDSDVSRINRAAVGEVIAIHPWTAEVLKTAMQLAEDSGGVFNVACAPKLVEWGYLPNVGETTPSYCPGNGIFIFEAACRIRKTVPGWIDLGGIAKGYAVDRAVSQLQLDGVPAGCVNAGGDLRVFGEAAIPVLIRDPRQPSQMCAEILIQHRALATSATYFSRKDRGRGAVSALINGKSGEPISHAKSISVQAADCMIADALTKYVAATHNPMDPLLRKYSADALII